VITESSTASAGAHAGAPQSADRPHRVGRLPRRPTLIAAALCLISFASFWVAQRVSGVSMIDLMVYRAEGQAVRTGQDLYALRATHAHLPATYPPFAGLLFTALTPLPVALMRALATAVNLVLLVAMIQLSLRLIGHGSRMPRAAATLLAASAAVWCEPVWTTLRYGQINLLLAVLVLRDLTRREGARWAGAGIGLAAGIKLTPALFALTLALCGVARAWPMRGERADGQRRAWNPWLRQATVAAAAFAGTVLLAWVLLPDESRRYWGGAAFRSDRAGPADITDNQSLRGIVARLLHTGHPGWPWLVLAAAVGVLGLTASVATRLAGPRLAYGRAWSALACACTALLVSPVSWSHHWVWCVPLALLLGAEAMRRRSGGRAWWWAMTAVGALVFCSYVLWWVPHGVTGPARPELHQAYGQMALSAVYPATGLGFLVLATAMSLRPPSPGDIRAGDVASGQVPCQTTHVSTDQAVAKE
jgi:hypothetical protein